MKKLWTNKMVNFLERHYPFKNNGWIALKLKVSCLSVKSKATVLQLRKIVRADQVWFPDMIKKLKRWYPNHTNKWISKKMKMRETQISAMAFKLSLRKSKEFMMQCCGKTCFKKGHIPINKGKRQSEFMSKEAIKRTMATRFKKGQKPHNTLFDEAITIRPYRTKQGKIIKYKWIRIAEGKWMMLHVYNWVKKFGPLPKGHIVVFKTKDTMNCEVSNCEMITLEENMRRNSIHNYPPELRSTIRTLSKLNNTIYEKQNPGLTQPSV